MEDDFKDIYYTRIVFNSMKEKVRAILKRYWGYEQFRPLQEEIILSVLSGKDTLALLPTGGGKSLCFQVPGLVIEDGMTLVISPLIALMQDQVMNLQKRGIPAAALTSSLHSKAIEKIMQEALNGDYKFLYISPERLEVKNFIEEVSALNIKFLAVDEAHCISQWGYDFRPSYLKIAEIKKHLYSPDIPTIALTASATKQVLEDIIEKLELRQPALFRQSFARKNLRYVVLYESDKMNRIQRIIKNIGGAGIIYVRSRNKTKEIADMLIERGISADYFHAGLSGEEKYFKQKKFIENAYQVMVATNAFGMGIDKPDVRYVIHYELSDSIESYFQEAGRGGRDSKTSYAVLLYTEADKDKALRMLEESFPPLDAIKKVYTHLCNYFEIPMHEGEGRVFDFNMNDIAQLYHLPLHLLFHSVKFLEMFDLISITDEAQHSSRCHIPHNKLDIYNFYIHHPEYEDLIKTLLRSYGGILSHFVYIHEGDIAHRIHRDKRYVTEQLKFLDKEGIIEYQPLTGLPKIIFLKDRVPVSELKWDEEKYHFLKKRRTFLVQKMIEYAEQSYLCRQQFLLNYFDEKDSSPCGYCDVCIKQKQFVKIEEAKKQLYQLISTREEIYNIKALCQVFQQEYSKEIIIQAIREMIDDNIFIIDHEERVRVKE